MTDGLKDAHRDAIVNIFRSYKRVERAVLFGSRAMETFTQGSDVDIALFGESLTTADQARLVMAMEELTIPQRIDLVLYDGIQDTALRKHVQQHGVELYTNCESTSTWSGISENSRILTPKKSISRRKVLWPEVPLSEITTAIIGGTPSRGRSDYWGGKIPWATAKDVAAVSSRHLEHVTEYITERGLASSAAKLMPKSTIIITARGTVGALAQLKTPMAFNQTCYAIQPKNGLDVEFLYWALKGTLTRMKLLTYGTVFETITMSTFDNWKIPLPSFSEQRAIAHILGILDDKIELNRRMNKTLEAMARAIFKDWFVDFGPVRAKMAGHEPYLSSELWDLFPDAFGDNGLPKGWNNGILADIAESPKRSVSPMDVQQETPYIGLEHMPRRSISLDVWDCAGTVTSNKSIFKKGEILFGKLRPYFHKVGRAPVDGICSTDIVVVNPKGVNWDAFTLQYLSSDEFVNYTSQVASGTKMPRTSWKLMGQYQITHPTEQIASAFQTLLSPMINRIENNSLGTRHLATIRDVLLPRLVSGEIRVCEAEKQAEAIVS